MQYHLLRTKKDGFTLIEVLIAAVILFASISTVSMVFRGAFLSSTKAEEHIRISGVIPSILSNVREDIRSSNNQSAHNLSGRATTWEVEYQWSAEITSFKPPQPTFSPESGELDYYQPRYKLWSVHLKVKYKTLEKNYQFNEISWLND